MARTRNKRARQAEALPDPPVEHVEAVGPNPDENEGNLTGDHSRGRSLLKKLDDRLLANGGNKIVIEADAHGAPNTDDGKLVSDLIGSIMSSGEIIPLTIKDWRLVSNGQINSALVRIHTFFEFPNPATNGWLKAKCNERWKSAKNRLKDRWEDPKPDDPNKGRPPSFSPESWNSLVDYWSTPKVQEKATQNAANRKNLKVFHRTGRVGYPRTLAAETKKRGGVAPDTYDFFLCTHKPTKGNIDPHTQAVVDAIEERITQAPEGTPVPEARELAVSAVLGSGSRGRVPMGGMVQAKKYTYETIMAQASSVISKWQMVADKANETAEMYKRQAEQTSKELEDSRCRNGDILRRLDDLMQFKEHMMRRQAGRREEAAYMWNQPSLSAMLAEQDQDRPYDQSLHRPTSRPQFMSGSQSQYMHPDRFRDMCADPFLYRSQHQNFHGPTYPSDTHSPGHARPHVHSHEQPY